MPDLSDALFRSSFFRETSSPETISAEASSAEASSAEAESPDGGRRPKRQLAAVGAFVAIAATAVPMTMASADPSPDAWYRLRMCESSNTYNIDTGNGYYGAYQFDLATWQSVGGSGYPSQASPAEQDARALILYRLRGWQPWTCAGIVGLQEDADARSGRTSDITVPTAGTQPAPVAPPVAPPIAGPVAPPVAASEAPPWPGERIYSQGDWNDVIAAWQLQMKSRGAPFQGTGQFGPITVSVAERLQAANGLYPTGTIGPNTWRLAWEGAY